mgnify:FL=1
MNTKKIERREKYILRKRTRKKSVSMLVILVEHSTTSIDKIKGERERERDKAHVA